MLKLKETEADLCVKQRLWDATEREICGLGEKYAAAHVVGEAYSDGQKDVTCAAKARGYPKGLIRELGRADRAGDDAARASALIAYRLQIGL